MSSDPSDKLIHDLSSPFSVVKGFLAAIDGIEMSKELREYYELALSCADRIVELMRKRPGDAVRVGNNKDKADQPLAAAKRP